MEIGILKGIRKADINSVMVDTKHSVIQMGSDIPLTEKEKNILRA